MNIDVTRYQWYKVTDRESGRVRSVVGLRPSREKDVLDALIAAGPCGTDFLAAPLPRHSAYIFNLRSKEIEIETVRERHGGKYPGTHARYILRSSVEAIPVEDVL